MSFNQRMILLAEKLGVQTCQIKYMIHYIYGDRTKSPEEMVDILEKTKSDTP